jgi:hypothetical protein
LDYGYTKDGLCPSGQGKLIHLLDTIFASPYPDAPISDKILALPAIMVPHSTEIMAHFACRFPLKTSNHAGRSRTASGFGRDSVARTIFDLGYGRGSRRW